MLKRLSQSSRLTTEKNYDINTNEQQKPLNEQTRESSSWKKRRSMGNSVSTTLQLPPDCGGVVKKGIVLKRGRNRFYHPWYLNSLVITDQNMMLYYDGESLRGKVSLHGAIVRMLSHQEIKGKPYGLEISKIPLKQVLKEDRIFFVVGSELEANEWMNAFELAQRMYMSRSSSKYESFGVSTKTSSLSLFLSLSFFFLITHISLQIGYDAKAQKFPR
jgi:hypothetical protein